MQMIICIYRYMWHMHRPNICQSYFVHTCRFFWSMAAKRPGALANERRPGDTRQLPLATAGETEPFQALTYQVPESNSRGSSRGSSTTIRPDTSTTAIKMRFSSSLWFAQSRVKDSFKNGTGPFKEVGPDARKRGQEGTLAACEAPRNITPGNSIHWALQAMFESTKGRHITVLANGPEPHLELMQQLQPSSDAAAWQDWRSARANRICGLGQNTSFPERTWECDSLFCGAGRFLVHDS